MKKIVIAIPHSHTWFWSSTCIAALKRNPPKADGYECQIVVVDNSPWSPAILGLMKTSLSDGITIVSNAKSNKFHASALDFVAESYDFDLLMALETDVMALRSDWLQWFVDQLKPTDYAVGHWHHELFVNPSCTLYRGDVLREMNKWCKTNQEPDMLRWGPNFSNVADIFARQPERDYQGWYDDNVSWVVGPFADKRGWPPGTVLKEKPSGQEKGPGWYEPGQMLHHWAIENGHTYTICKTGTTYRQAGMPIMTFYGNENVYDRQLEYADLAATDSYTVHFWGGTRALDIIKHEVTCNFVKSSTPFWLEREARLWRDSVPLDVQEQTLMLIKNNGWHYRGLLTPNVTERDREAARMVQSYYANGGIVF